MPFLSDPDYLKYKGFRLADTARPYYELLYLPFGESTPPAFRDCVKAGPIQERGMALYYSNQCPYTDQYVPLLKALAEQKGTTIKLIKLETAEQAQNAPAPFTTYSFFYGGEFVTNEIFSEKKFKGFLEEHGF